MVKVGCLWSGRGGSGLVVSKLSDGNWSAPSAIFAMGCGVGAQFGASITDFVFVLNNEAALRAFSVGGTFTLGTNVSMAVGPTGRSAEAGGSALFLAPIYSYSKSKGAFVGITLEGTVITTRKDANAVMYGRPVKARDILGGSIAPPAEAAALYRVLNSSCFAAMGVTRADIEPLAQITTLKRQVDPIKKVDQENRPNQGNTQKLEELRAKLMETTSNVSNQSIQRPKPPSTSSKSIRLATAVALYDFNPSSSAEIPLKAGDVIKVTKKEGEWWTGSINGGPIGEFPYKYF